MPEASLPKYRLKKDLYVVRPDKLDPYVYFTKAELDEAIHIEHAAGGIYEFDGEQLTLSHPERATFGIDAAEPDPELWEPYVPLDLAPGDYDVAGPGGETIVGTFDLLTGQAIVNGVTVGDDGKIEPAYEGTTEVHWNDQRTKFEAGERLYVDDDCGVWRESQLVFTPRPEAKIDTSVPAVAIFPYDSEGGQCD